MFWYICAHTKYEYHIGVIMLPRKKLEFYAQKHGVEYFASIRMNEDDVARISEVVGSRALTMSDCGGRLSTFIDCVTDDAKYREKIRARMSANGKMPSEEMFLIRMGDYAADEVMAAYAALHPAKKE